jgi:DNA end-binding protein Ku
VHAAPDDGTPVALLENMARAMWKAVLRLGRIEVPVKLYAGAQERDVHFRLLHRKDRVPVAQQMVDPRTNEPIEADAIRRGIELERGRFVALSDEEIEATRPEPSRGIEITRCVPRAAIDPGWFLRPYYLGPDGSAAEIAALAQALEASERVGIGRWVLRGKRSFGMLEARDGRLALVAMRPANDVVAVDELGLPRLPPATRPAERALAAQLVAALDGPFDPALLRDEYRERVEALIRAKRSGRKLRISEPPPPEPRSDLARALRESLSSIREPRVAA